MSDTKQQCPTCRSNWKHERRIVDFGGYHGEAECADPWHDETKQQCPPSCANHGKPVCPWHNYSVEQDAPSGGPIEWIPSDGYGNPQPDGKFRTAKQPSPAVAPSGAREQLEAEIASDISYANRHRKGDAWLAVTMTERAQKYADSLTAPLREQSAKDKATLDKYAELIDTAMACGHAKVHMLVSAETGEDLYCDLCDRNDQIRDVRTELTAERTRREAAERELKELRDMVVEVIAAYGERDGAPPTHGRERISKAWKAVRAALRGKGE